MARTLTAKLIDAHRVDGGDASGDEVALRIDQTLTQDATGTLVMLELEALGLDRVRTELSVQYVDHNLLQEDHRNPDDHRFLESACKRYGIWYSPPGTGVSHPVHQECFGRPGASLAGSDSHTCAAGALGMLALGCGGLEVALAMAGEPLVLPRPRVIGVRLVGRLDPWVSAKDVVLELLRRRGVAGAVGAVLEYSGPGLEQLSVMDRHVIANMGAETGATTSVFPSDDVVRDYLAGCGRPGAWEELAADRRAEYDEREEIDLRTVEPLIARPPSPGDVVPVRELEGLAIDQAYIGSSANPGYRDFAAAAAIVEGHVVPPHVSLDVNPTTRQVLQQLVASGALGALVGAGARIHQAGCNGCIGMGQAPATDGVSLRTVPRNFPGRSGTLDARVYLCSPETAAASARSGRVTDPRTLGDEPPRIRRPGKRSVSRGLRAFVSKPLPAAEACLVDLVKGPNVTSIPELEPLGEPRMLPVLLRLTDDVSTDEILPAGARTLPLRSNLEAIAEHAFRPLDGSYPERAREVADRGGHVVVAGRNYGQGSSREHAALAPRILGLRAVVAAGFARIHRSNLIQFGVLPLELVDLEDLHRIHVGDLLRVAPVEDLPDDDGPFEIERRGAGGSVRVRLAASPRERAILRAGGRLAQARQLLVHGA